MSEIATTPKSLSSPCATLRDEVRVEKNLARCVRRRFQMYTQLPVRCQNSSPHYRPPRTSPFRLTGLTAMNPRSPVISTAKSTPESSRCNSILRAIGTPRCKRSLSMIDLSIPASNDPENTDLRSDSSSLEGLEDVNDKGKEMTNSEGGSRWFDLPSMTDYEETGSRFYQNPKKAASIICQMLVLNAWRHRRMDVQHLRDAMEKLNQQVDHLHLQIIVLRKLLETENNRVSRCTTEIHRIKSQLDDALRVRDALKTEKEKMEEEVTRLSDLSEERLVTTENLRNELLTAQNELESLHERNTKDREKLSKYREDNRSLLDEVAATKAVVVERGGRILKAEDTIEELHIKLATQIALVDSSQEQLHRYTNELNVKEEEKSALEERVASLEESEESLRSRTAFLEAELVEREASLRRIESAYNSQLTEINELRERLVQQSQESGWSSRMLQIAGTVVRAPRAILRTLSFLSGPPLLP